MTKRASYCEKRVLGLALLFGVCLNGSWDALFSPIIHFSVFPLVSMVLAFHVLQQQYLKLPRLSGIPLLIVACFFLGWFIYSAMIRVAYPQIGSNFWVALFCVALVLWIGVRRKQLKKYAQDDDVAS